MTRLKLAASIAAVAAAMIAAAPASAVVSTFASFSTIGTAADLRFVNSGNSTSPSRTTDAIIYSTAAGNSVVPGSVNVRFSFLQSAFVTQPAVQNVVAKFTFLATVAKGTPATTGLVGTSTFFDQPGVTGTFSFLTTTAITVTGPNFVTHTYAAGSNLLSATFSGIDITGKVSGSAGGADGSTLGGDHITYTSDFLNFTPTIERDLALSLTSVAPTFGIHTGVNKALNSFRTNAGGQFSSDPAPIINGLAIVPEPAVWGLLVVGFGMVGFQTRRRNRSSSVTA